MTVQQNDFRDLLAGNLPFSAQALRAVPGGSPVFPFGFGGTPKAEEKGEKSKKQRGRGQRKYLDTYCENLTQKAKDGKLSMEDLTGGTFSISNGGVFGSMLSTPIINPPQSAILGIHATKDRPVVENGQIVIRPINYLALSYDHRIIDGRESVGFLVSIKELLEDPTRLLLDV